MKELVCTDTESCPRHHLREKNKSHTLYTACPSLETTTPRVATCTCRLWKALSLTAAEGHSGNGGWAEREKGQDYQKVPHFKSHFCHFFFNENILSLPLGDNKIWRYYNIEKSPEHLLSTRNLYYTRPLMAKTWEKLAELSATVNETENLSIDKTWQVPARPESLEKKVEGNKNLFKEKEKFFLSVEDLKSHRKFFLKRRGGR